MRGCGGRNATVKKGGSLTNLKSARGFEVFKYRYEFINLLLASSSVPTRPYVKLFDRPEPLLSYRVRMRGIPPPGFLNNKEGQCRMQGERAHQAGNGLPPNHLDRL